MLRLPLELYRRAWSRSDGIAEPPSLRESPREPPPLQQATECLLLQQLRRKLSELKRPGWG